MTMDIQVNDQHFRKSIIGLKEASRSFKRKASLVLKEGTGPFKATMLSIICLS